MLRLSFFTSFVTLALVAKSYAGIGPVADLTVSNAVISPDGFPRDAVVVNGVFPAPLITGKKGDRFQLNVKDDLTNHTMLKSTSIHWHGLFQKGTNWADGAASVNQCPIASGHSFLYDFQAVDQAGTFWYHSHLSTQYCDGLRGPLVVYDPNDPHADLYDVDDDSTVITLAEWYHTAAKLRPQGPAVSDSTVINGLGRSTVTPTADLAVISVTQGKRYRFRLLSLSCDPFHTFSIDGHDLTIIEADGVNTEPLVVDSVPIFAGQRYSFVLNANKDIDNYWIRADISSGTTGFAGGINSAILRYDGAAPIEPAAVTPPTSVNPLVETDLHPLADMPVPGEPTKGGVDKAINFEFSFSAGNFFMNNATFTPPTVPVLLQILSGTQPAQNLLPSGSVFELPSQSTIELTLPAAAIPGGPHPFHLHGHTFAVVRSAGSTTYNYDNPIWRDVVSTGAIDTNDNVTIRFTTDNPGPWFLHCHIDFHLDAGFAVVFAESLPETQAANPVPQAWDDLCPIYDALAEEDQ